MHNAITIFVGFLLVLLSGVMAEWFDVDVAIPNVGAIVVVYAVLHRETFWAIATAFAVGVLGSVLTGGARGETMLGLLAVAGVATSARHRFQIDSAWTAAAWCTAGSVAADATTALLLALFRQTPAVLGLGVRVIPAAALATGAAALVLFRTLGDIEPRLRARQERSNLLR